MHNVEYAIITLSSSRLRDSLGFDELRNTRD